MTPAIRKRFLGAACAAVAFLAGAASAPVQARGADQATPASTNTGSVCLASIHDPTPGAKSLYNYAAGNPTPDYSVQFDKGPIVNFTHSPKGEGPGILITGMPLDRSYRVSLRHQGKPIESFRFRFDKESTANQCLFLEPFYLTWQLWQSTRLPTCRCKDATSMPWAGP